MGFNAGFTAIRTLAILLEIKAYLLNVINVIIFRPKIFLDSDFSLHLHDRRCKPGANLRST